MHSDNCFGDFCDALDTLSFVGFMLQSEEVLHYTTQNADKESVAWVHEHPAHPAPKVKSEPHHIDHCRVVDCLGDSEHAKSELEIHK